MPPLAADLSLSRRTLPGLAIIGVFWGAFAALIPDIKASLGLGDAGFGTVMLAAAFGSMVAMAAAPAIEQRVGAATPSLAAALAALSFLLVGAAPNVPVFALGVFLGGTFTGLLDIAVNVRVAAAEERAGRSLMNLNHAGYSLIYGIAAASMAVPREIGIAPVWSFLVIALGVLALARSLATPAEPPGPADPAAPAGGARAFGFTAIAIWTGIITLIGFFAENATEGWSALHVERTLGGRAAEGALGPAVLGLTMFAGRLAGHMLTLRGQEGRVIVGAALVSASGALLAAFAWAPWVAYLGFGILGLGVSVTAPLALSLAGRLAAPGHRALTVARCSLLGFTGFFIGPPLMGWISAAAGLRTAYAAVALLLLIMPLALLVLRRAAAATPSRR